MGTIVSLSTMRRGFQRVEGGVTRSAGVVTIVGTSTCKRNTIPITRLVRSCSCV